MPKTSFSNGSIVYPAFLNSIFSTGGGHVHDGGTNDGSSSKIHPINHVLGSSKGSFNLTFKGFTVDQVSPCNYYKNSGQSAGDPTIVKLEINEFSGTSNAAYLNTVVGDLPAAIRPNTVVRVPVVLIDNSVNILGILKISDDGLVETEVLSSTVVSPKIVLDTNIFVTSGIKGMRKTCAIYHYYE
jgi:hypothetical protein